MFIFIPNCLAYPTDVFSYIHYAKWILDFYPREGWNVNSVSCPKVSFKVYFNSWHLCGCWQKGQLFTSLISSFIVSLSTAALGQPKCLIKNTSTASKLHKIPLFLENEHLLSAVFTELCAFWIGLCNGNWSNDRHPSQQGIILTKYQETLRHKWGR